MRMQSQAVLHGIKSSKGDYEGRAFDSTTFHLSVDMGQSASGESIGVVTRPFKLGEPFHRPQVIDLDDLYKKDPTCL